MVHVKPGKEEKFLQGFGGEIIGRETSWKHNVSGRLRLKLFSKK
jgi:hypothetical protein